MTKICPIVFIILFFSLAYKVEAQQSVLSAGRPAKGHLYKPISKDLFGVFFEDLSYAADGGLYAELVQNRSFEYSASDNNKWNPLTNWEYKTTGYGYGTISVETAQPLHANNPHYVVFNVDDAGQQGVGITNAGYGGITLKAGNAYNFSVYIHQITSQPVPIQVELRDKKNVIYGKYLFNTQAGGWKKYSAVITVDKDADSASLNLLVKDKAKVAVDEVSLFPQKTFKAQSNGLRADLAQSIADLQPKFMRFPGGCLVHGDGLGNMYQWKNTIGPVEERVQQRNIWKYHQSVGLGFFEYFRFCEDIGAQPVPIVSAGVSCQNSGGTWAIGSSGQKGIPLSDMKEYIQDVLDLIEYANGPVTSIWGAKRAAAGHPKPFGLHYIGIGNEDKQTDDFRERFKIIYDVVRAKHPEVIIIGTVGPAPDGEDYDMGWKFADQLAIPVVDEHFYAKPDWFLSHNDRYDQYSRQKSQVYIGEYASRDNALINALSEAAFMTSIERNGDVVRMASYAPLLANVNQVSWAPNLIYFNNKKVALTVNYYVQQLFSVNDGDTYISNVVSFPNNKQDSTLAASCVKNRVTGDLIIKMVNVSAEPVQVALNLAALNLRRNAAVLTVLSGDPKDKNTMDQPEKCVPVSSKMQLDIAGKVNLAPYSLNIIRVPMK